MTVQAYLSSLSPALTASLGMGLAIWFLKVVLPAQWRLRDRFVVEVLGGGVAYGLIVLTRHLDRLRALLEFVRSARK